MKVILQPTVTVIGISQFIEHPVYKIPKDGTDAERLGAFAAKGCYDSFGEDGRANIINQTEVINHRHGSVLEHAHTTVFVEGVSRALTLESNRHRTFGISQRSTRYTKEEDASIVLEPYYARLYKKYGMQNQVWNESEDVENGDEREIELVSGVLQNAEADFAEYRKQVDTLCELNPLQLKGFDLRKWARGKARNLLPHSLETRVTYTGNYRAWRWFLEARSARGAEPEIRRLADSILIALRPLAPTYFQDFELISTYDDIPEWKPTNRKV